MDLKFYLGVIFRRWWIIVLSTMLVGGVSYYRANKKPLVYQGLVRVLYESNTVASNIMGTANSVYAMSWSNPVDTQLQLITTRPNVEEVIRRLGADPGYRGLPLTPESVQQGLSSEVDRNTDIILLRYTCLHGETAVRVVNEMGRVFVERSKTAQQVTAHETRKFIEMQLAKTEGLLGEAEDALRRFRETNQLFAVSGAGNDTAGQLVTIDTKLIDMSVDRKVAEVQLAEARRHLEVTDLDLSQRLEKLHADKLFTSLQDELARGQAALEVQKTQYTADSPEVRDATARLAKLTAAIHGRIRLVLGKGIGTDLLVGRTASEERYLTQLIDAQVGMILHDTRARALKATRSEYESRFAVLPAKEQQLSQLLRRREAAEQSYSVFLKKMQEVKITEAVNTGNVRVIEEAVNAVLIDDSPLSKTVSISALLGLVFGLGVALLIEFLDDRIRRPEEAQNVLELPILGLLPWVESRNSSRRGLVVLEDPRSSVTESYRALQTYTRMVDPDTKHQCIMLTSPGPKEGKSTILANLAVTSAQLGKRTLIIDTDMRAPSQHINFDRPNLVGIYDVVYEKSPLGEVIQPTDVQNLDILCTGPVPPDPVQTLHSEAFKAMIEQLKLDYDTIFFDSPPINLFTDAAVLGGIMDSVLLVVDVRSTTRQSTLTAKELLVKARVPLSGLVVKNMAQKTSKHQNRYFERYYLDRLHHLADD